jgi:hypothetical protein
MNLNVCLIPHTKIKDEEEKEKGEEEEEGEKGEEEERNR